MRGALANPFFCARPTNTVMAQGVKRRFWRSEKNQPDPVILVVLHDYTTIGSKGSVKKKGGYCWEDQQKNLTETKKGVL